MFSNLTAQFAAQNGSGSSVPVPFLIFLVPAVFVFLKVRSLKLSESREERAVGSLPASVQHAVAQMDALSQSAFFKEYFSKRKKLSTAYICWLFGFHHLYVKKVGKQILFLLSCPTVIIPFIWWIVDFFRMTEILGSANEQLARQALQTLAIGNQFNMKANLGSTNPTAPPPPPASTNWDAPAN